MQELTPVVSALPRGAPLSQKLGLWLASAVVVAGASPTSTAALRSSKPSSKEQQAGGRNKTSEDNYCEITGMNTLLCAPIQTQMQQREISVTEYNHEETHSNDQTVIFSDENQMDLTASHTVMITKGLLDCTKNNLSEIENQTQTVMVDVTTGYRTKAPAKTTVFESKPNAAFPDSPLNPKDTSSLLMEKTIYSGEDSMDITKSQTLVIDNQIFKEDQTNVQITAKPISEKEMMLQNHITMSKDEEMNVNCISVPHVSKERLQQAQADPLSTSLAGKKTVIFTGEDKGLTKSHTTNLGSQAPFASYNLAFKDASTSHSDSKSLLDEWGKKTKTHNELSRQPKIISTNILTDAWGKEIDQVLKISPYFDKVSPQPVDINQDKATSYNIVYSGGDLHKQVALGKNRNTVSCEQALFPITKLSSEGQSAMENHNTAVNSHIVKSVPDQNSKLPEPLRKSLGNPNLDCSHNKIITCSEVEQNMDLTKSHTVVIGFGPSEVQELSKTNLERTILADRPDFELFKRKSLGKIKVTSSAEESVSFPENGESDHSAAKVSQLTLLGDRSNSGPIEKAVAFIADENIDVSTSTVWKNDKDIQKPGFLNEHLSGKSQRRKSLRLKDDKPIAFSSNDKNDMDIIQSCTMEINNKNALEDIQDSLLVPLAGTSKTVLYTSGQDDMEITRIHTTALECKTISPVKITTRPMDNTVLFIDNHSDLEVTKSNTAFIDCQATEKILQECPKFGIVKRKTLGVSFPKDGSSVQEVTKQQAQAIENKIVLQTEQEHHVIPCSNTLSGDQAQIEIIKFHSTAGAKVVDKAYTLEKAKLESCHLNSTGKRNVDFTNNHAPAICGSSDNYSFLPNVISYVDNLEGNVMSLCDKDEKASNCPVQNDLAYANDLASEYYLKSEALPLSAPCSVLEKEKVTQTNTQGQLNDCVITVLKDQDLIKEPPNLLANQTLVYGQDLGNMTKLDSKQLSPLPQQGQSIVNKGEAILSQAATYRNSQMEPQFLTDTVCEESLKEKLKDGRITIKEFFILLQVHILIQKPRQSTLPTKNEREKLQLKIDEMDNILKKIANCLTQVKIESKNLENEEKDSPVEEWDSEMRAAEKELEQLKTEEEKLQRNLSELEVQKEQTLAQIDFMQKQTNTTEELLDQLSLSEWDVIEWSDDQAVFTFLYDTVELTITFGEPVEDKAPPSSLLVHKLIFQYIEEQESWKKKCTTQHQVSKMLQEISLVVSHCRLLGEEIEFLKRWGPNYKLMNIDVNNTDHDEIFALLSKVPLEDNYLKNVVKQIYQDLLQGCNFHQETLGPQL
ncbi:Protein CASC5 [Myotis brandtii]|uniref:Protein CASC5 n=1 Tax=Myotis brandtii TaxID=109478 RepID=S7P8D0_MYOBR|nr:Protein CASC5 [Myotis brandtii]